jgi:hypothetical protein
MDKGGRAGTGLQGLYRSTFLRAVRFDTIPDIAMLYMVDQIKSTERQ